MIDSYVYSDKNVFVEYIYDRRCILLSIVLTFRD
jgi:hypothetical protein